MKYFGIISILSTMMATSSHAWIGLSETTCHDIKISDATQKVCSYYQMYGPSPAFNEETGETTYVGGYGHTHYFQVGGDISYGNHNEGEITVDVTWDDMESTTCEATINGAVCDKCERCPTVGGDSVTLDCGNVQDTVSYSWSGGTQQCASLAAMGASPPFELDPIIIIDDPIPHMTLPCFETREELKQVVDAYLSDDSDGFYNGWYMGPIGDWCVGLVQDFSYMFDGYETFNEPLNNWGMSSAVTTEGMFRGCKAFDQDISSWDMSKVENMRSMFEHAESFNQDIDDWNVESVRNMNRMFAYAKVFNQDLDSWDTSNVESMRMMFGDAVEFNGDIESWQVDNVKTMNRAFLGAKAFNRDISSWNISKVGDFRSMFYRASSFDQNLCAWGEDVDATRAKVNQMFGRTSCESTSEPEWFGEDAASGYWCQACIKVL